MANTQSRSSSLFSGIFLMTVGVLLMLHNYGHLELGRVLSHWWPLLIIFWGMVKLYERTAGRRFGGGSSGVSSGEVLLVFGMLAILGAIAGVESIKSHFPVGGESYSFDDLDVPSQAIPEGARLSVRVGHGDITLRASDDHTVRITAKKQVTSWSESEAARISKPVKVVMVKNGDGYEIRPEGFDLSDSRIGVDLEIEVPKKSPVVVKSEKGDAMISDMSADVSLTLQNGDAELRNTKGDVSVETRKGDVKVSDTTGNVKVEGKGGEIEAINTSGSFTVDGDFYGPIRADKSVKGIRLITAKTDLTLSSLAGHLEAGSGNLDIVDAPGNLTLRTRATEVSLENPGGKVNIENRDANVNVRFSYPPKDDVSVSNSSSGISVSIPGSSSFDLDADCNRCDIDSEFSNLVTTKSPSGDSVLVGKNGSGRGPKIVLKTTYGNIDLRRTSASSPGKSGPVSPPSPASPPSPPSPSSAANTVEDETEQ